MKTGKSQEEFEIMAKENKYFDEAYTALKKMSADEQKRLEYEEIAEICRISVEEVNEILF